MREAEGQRGKKREGRRGRKLASNSLVEVGIEASPPISFVDHTTWKHRVFAEGTENHIRRKDAVKSEKKVSFESETRLFPVRLFPAPSGFTSHRGAPHYLQLYQPMVRRHRPVPTRLREEERSSFQQLGYSDSCLPGSGKEELLGLLRGENDERIRVSDVGSVWESSWMIRDSIWRKRCGNERVVRNERVVPSQPTSSSPRKRGLSSQKVPL